MAKKEATLLLKIKSVGEQFIRSAADRIKDLSKAVLAAGIAIAGFVGASVGKFRVQELAINKLNQSMVQQGVFTKDLSTKYQQMSADLQKVTTVGDEATISAISQLQAYIGQKEVTKDLVKATLDFSSAMGVDLKSAADLVGKSIGSSTNGLSRYGIALEAGLSESEKMVAVTEALQNRFGGQSEAMADGLGSMTQLSNAFGDFMERIGEKFAPVITAISQSLLGMVDSMSGSSQIIDMLVSGLMKTFEIGVSVASAMDALGSSIGVGLAAAVEALGEVLSGNFAKAKEIVSLGMDEVSEIQTTKEQEKNDKIKAIRDRLAANEVNARNKETLLFQKSLLRKDIIKASNDKKELVRIKKLNEKKKAIDDKKAAEDKEKRDKEAAQLIADRKSTGATIARLAHSNNKVLATIGKAAALTQIAIEAPKGVSKALGAFPPPFNFAAAGAVAAAFAAQAAKVAGIQLADGGIVSATQGGTHAILGEGGQDEAVVPLDDAGGIGTTVNITVNGGFLGDESSARELALAVDNELFKLRQGNESVAFDEDIL